MSIFSKRIVELRKSRKMTQAEVAKLLGVTQVNVYKYEKGFSEPPFKTALWYADYFGVSLDYLFGRTDNPYFTSPKESPKENMHPLVSMTYSEFEELMKKTLKEAKE